MARATKKRRINHIGKANLCQNKSSKFARQIKDGVERYLAGKMDAKTFDEFIKTSNTKLDALAAEKKRKADEAWWRYSTTFC